MTLSLSNLKSFKGATKKKKRVGRGNASGRGTYAGRGQKGQRSRSGGKRKSGYLGKKNPPFLFKIPKVKGFKSFHPKLEIVNLDELSQKFQEGEIVNPRKLLERGLIRTDKFGVKILGRGELKKKLKVRAQKFSKTAKETIEKSGGEVEFIMKNKKNLANPSKNLKAK